MGADVLKKHMNESIECLKAIISSSAYFGKCLVENLFGMATRASNHFNFVSRNTNDDRKNELDCQVQTPIEPSKSSRIFRFKKSILPDEHAGLEHVMSDETGQGNGV